MASRSGEIDYKPHTPLAGPSDSTPKTKSHNGSDLDLGQGLEASGLAPGPTEDIEMEKIQQIRERERLLGSENKPNRLEGKPTSFSSSSSSSSNSTSTEPTNTYHRKTFSLTSLENIDDAYPSSDDEAASAAWLKGRRKHRTSWLTAPLVHGKRGGEKNKRTKVSKVAVCIGIAGGITVLVSVIVGGGVMVLGRKPVAKSEGWYPAREFSSLLLRLDILLTIMLGGT